MSKFAILVAGTLELPGAVSPARLEDDADRLLDVLEGEFGEIVIGPVVGCDLERSVINVRFSIEGTSSAEVHQHVSNVSARIDDAVGGRVRTATEPTDQLEVACA